MIQWSISLRALAFLRRLTVAVESIAASQRTVAQLMVAEWERKHPAARPRMVEVGTLDVDKVEAEWKREQEAHDAGVEPQ